MCNLQGILHSARLHDCKLAQINTHTCTSGEHMYANAFSHTHTFAQIAGNFCPLSYPPLCFNLSPAASSAPCHLSPSFTPSSSLESSESCSVQVWSPCRMLYSLQNVPQSLRRTVFHLAVIHPSLFSCLCHQCESACMCVCWFILPIRCLHRYVRARLIHMSVLKKRCVSAHACMRSACACLSCSKQEPLLI